MCPWHGWEYSVVTGRGPEGYDEEQVPVFEVEERADGVYVATPPASPRRCVKHKPSHLLERASEAARRAAPRARHLDHGDGRGESALLHLRRAARARAGPRRAAASAPTRSCVRLRELRFRPCEGNYSKAARACTWPCAITERDPADQLTRGLRGARPLGRRGAGGDADPLGHRLLALLQDGRAHELHPEPDHDPRPVLIKNKVAAFIITGGQDNIQAVAGSMLTFWAELGFVFPPFPFIAHSRGWDAEDMEQQRPSGEGERGAAHGRGPSSPSAPSTPGGCWTPTARSSTSPWSGAAARPSASPRPQEVPA